MKKSVIIIIFLLLNLSTWGLEVRGQLSIDTNRTEGAITGESYRAVLTLVPFSLEMINPGDLENRSFLDYFYISKVMEIRASENNADAIQIFMELVIVKKFENQSFKIWSLHDRNIPISFKLGEISETKLVVKKFITFDTLIAENKNWFRKSLFIVLAVLLGGVGLYYVQGRKRLVADTSTIDVIKELSISKSHSDFEWIYRNRKTLLHNMKVTPVSLKEFQELTNLIEKYQFRSSWKKKDISELVAKKNKVLESYKNGV